MRAPWATVVVMLLGLAARSTRALRLTVPAAQRCSIMRQPVAHLLASPTLRMMCSAPPVDIPTVDENGVPLSKSAIKKLQKAAAIAAKKAAK